MNPLPAAVLFDLDGTLIDHFQVIYRCYCYALEKLGLPRVSFEQVKAAVGGSVSVTMGKLIPAEYVDEAVRLFRERYDEIWKEDIIVLPGVRALVEHFHDKGVLQGMLTNKEGNNARRLAAEVGLDAYLDPIIGTLDTEYRKPQPELVQYTLEQLGATADETVFIGDSPYDFQTARNGGLKCYLAATGSHTVEQLQAETEADGIFTDMVELAREVWGIELPAEVSA
ncbi:MAG: phosphoglycolate phosphatase [Puniceicoccaceae bacterium 5H]|nr:MAG: phosphoglycolate phosphatase [Puniceicoccaceae bacterium 5H]